MRSNGPGYGSRNAAGPVKKMGGAPFEVNTPSLEEACRSYRGSPWLLRKAGGLDGLASSSSHYTCEKLLAASRPIPARRDWRLLGATSARFEQALWGEYLPEPPESTPTPHRSPSQGLAEDTVAGAQQACAPQIARSWCWPRRAYKNQNETDHTGSESWGYSLPPSRGRALRPGGRALGSCYTAPPYGAQGR